MPGSHHASGNAGPRSGQPRTIGLRTRPTHVLRRPATTRTRPATRRGERASSQAARSPSQPAPGPCAAAISHTPAARNGRMRVDPQRPILGQQVRHIGLQQRRAAAAPAPTTGPARARAAATRTAPRPWRRRSAQPDGPGRAGARTAARTRARRAGNSAPLQELAQLGDVRRPACPPRCTGPPPSTRWRKCSVPSCACAKSRVANREHRPADDGGLDLRAGVDADHRRAVPERVQVVAPGLWPVGLGADRRPQRHLRERRRRSKARHCRELAGCGRTSTPAARTASLGARRSRDSQRSTNGTSSGAMKLDEPT